MQCGRDQIVVRAFDDQALLIQQLFLSNYSSLLPSPTSWRGAGGEGVTMITEIALLQIRPGRKEEFISSFKKAQAIISRMNGYIEHSLEQCLEDDNRFLLLVKWETLEDHTAGFRQSEEYKEWKALLHHFYDPFPVVEHFERLNAESRTLNA